MKTIKAIVLMCALSLTVAAYAADDAHSSKSKTKDKAAACCKAGAQCCKPDAACCASDSCCAVDASCCKDGAACCAAEKNSCCGAGAECCKAGAQCCADESKNHKAGCCAGDKCHVAKATDK